MRRYHQARRDEPVTFELSPAGGCGILPPNIEPDIAAVAGAVLVTKRARAQAVWPLVLP